MNKLTEFDHLLKDSLESIEYPYDHSQWMRLEKSLPSSGGIGSSSIIAAGLAAVVIVGTFALFSGSLDNKEQTSTVYHNQSPEVTLTAHESEDITPLYIESNKELTSSPIELSNIEGPSSSKTEEYREYLVENKDDAIITISAKDENTTKRVIHEEALPIVESNSEFTPAVPMVNSTTVCAGEELQFEALTLNENIDLRWEFGDNSYSHQSNPTHIYNQPGTYQVDLISTSKLNGEVVNQSVATTVVVKETPSVDFEYVHSSNKARPITSFSTNSGTNNLMWDLGNGYKASGKSAETLYLHKGGYQVTLKAVGTNGCSNEITKTVYIADEYNLFAPNALTCNGDGINDANWFPRALEVLDFKFNLRIYDRMGRMVYKTSGVRPWNGVNQFTGEACPAGTYQWHVALTNDKGIQEEYQGAVTVFRQ